MLSFISKIATEFKTEQGKEKYQKAKILRMIRIPCCCIFGNTFAYFQKEEGGIISAVGAYLAIITCVIMRSFEGHFEVMWARFSLF